MAHGEKTVFYADGEKDSTRYVYDVIHRVGARIIHFDVPADCVASLATQECHLLISNSSEPAVDGMELLRETRRVAPEAPVIMLINQGDIQTAVRAMKAGASDCFERPPERGLLLPAINVALRRSANGSMMRCPALSEAEIQVLHLVLKGHTNAIIAQTLDRSRRTVEVHRGNFMRKLNVDGMVDLVRKCARLGLLQDWPPPGQATKHTNGSVEPFVLNQRPAAVPGDLT